MARNYEGMTSNKNINTGKIWMDIASKDIIKVIVIFNKYIYAKGTCMCVPSGQYGFDEKRKYID